jgi:hypothetical protein
LLDDEIIPDVKAPLDTAPWLAAAPVEVFDVTGDESLTVACEIAEEEYIKLIMATYALKTTTAAILAAVTREYNFIVTLYVHT